MTHTLNSHSPQHNCNQHREDSLNVDFPASYIEPEMRSPQSDALTKQNDDWSSATHELLDTLPQIWTRGLLYLLIAFAAIGLPWAMLSQVDETGSARGRLEPQGKSFKVDAPVAGTVAKVLVNEGQFVKEKQPLLELESQEIKSELQQVQTKLEGQLNRLAQLDLLKNQLLLGTRTQQQQNQAQELAKLAQFHQAQQNLDANLTTYNLEKVEKLAPIDQARQDLETSKTAYNLANSRFAKDMVEVKRYRELWQRDVIPETKVVEQEKVAEESQRLRLQAQSDIKQAKLRLSEQQSRYQTIIHQARSDIEQAKFRLQEQQKSYQSTIHSGRLAVIKNEEQLKELQTQITTLNAEISQSKSQIQSLDFQLGQRTIKAPVSGKIFQLPIQRIGAVVQPSTLIAEIAPKNYALILRAQMSTQESGSLDEGMPVKIKFDAYPFQDYGVVEGKLLKISPTSTVSQTAQGQTATFDLEIGMKQTCIQTSSRCIALTPGQTAIAEVIVQQRRVIDFILDPFKKLQKGGLNL